MYGGCFNPLHLGHVACMLQAANMCDKLIIVLSYSPNRHEVDVRLRYRWVYETVKHFPNVRIFVLQDDSPTKEEYSESRWYADASKVKNFAGEPITAVFFGDDYSRDSMWTRCYPEAEAVIFPRDGISSTEIRKAPLRHWEQMPAYVRSHYVKKVLLLGTESTGKSTLAVSLARYFNTVYLEEVGREISNRSGHQDWMLPDDFTDILLQHKLKQRQLLTQANRVFFEDTNCLTTEFYLHYLNLREHNKNSVLAEAIAELNDYDLVLMLQPNVPFVQDGTRSIQEAEERQSCNNFLISLCTRHQIKPILICGNDYQQRFQQAVELVKELLNDEE